MNGIARQRSFITRLLLAAGTATIFGAIGCRTTRPVPDSSLPAFTTAAAIGYLDPSVEPTELPIKKLTADDREAWIEVIKRSMMKPGCCGTCTRFTIEEGREVWKYISAADEAARTPEMRTQWFRHWRRLANEFLEHDPERFHQVYGRWPEGGFR